MDPRTLADIFFASVAHDLDRHLLFKRGSKWQVISSPQFYGYVVTMSRMLKQWGLGQGDRVAILSENRPEWMIVDFACVTSGLVDVPIYATLTAEQTLYVLQNSGARVACVSTLEQLRKVQSVQAHTHVEKIVVMDDLAEINAIPIWSLLDGASVDHDPEFDAKARSIQPDDLATLIYIQGRDALARQLDCLRRDGQQRCGMGAGRRLFVFPAAVARDRAARGLRLLPGWRDHRLLRCL
jgi:long-chain acyl-CoA synthetase